MTRKRKGKRHIPIIGERVLTPDGYARTVEVTRPQGVIGATVRLEDRSEQKTPAGGLHWYPCRELKPALGDTSASQRRGGRARDVLSGATRPRYVCVAAQGTKLSLRYDYAIHAPKCDCKERRSADLARADVWPRYERSPAEIRTNLRASVTHTGGDPDTLRIQIFDCAKRQQRSLQRTARQQAQGTKNPDLQGEKKPLQTTGRSGRVRSGKNQPTTTTKGGPTMAKTATVKGRKSRKATKSEPEKTNGKTRLSHEDKLKLVPQIVRRLKAGETFTDIRNDPDMPSSGLRKALADSGYDTSGNKIEEVPDLSDLSDAKLLKEVVKLRQNGKPWFYIELASGASHAELVEMLEESGHSDLVGRQVQEKDEDDEPAPKARKGRAKTGSKTKSSRGKAKATDDDEDEEEEEAPARRRGGRGRRRSNPS